LEIPSGYANVPAGYTITSSPLWNCTKIARKQTATCTSSSKFEEFTQPFSSAWPELDA